MGDARFFRLARAVQRKPIQADGRAPDCPDLLVLVPARAVAESLGQVAKLAEARGGRLLGTPRLDCFHIIA